MNGRLNQIRITVVLKVRQPKTDVLTTEPRRQHMISYRQSIQFTDCICICSKIVFIANPSFQ